MKPKWLEQSEYDRFLDAGRKALVKEKLPPIQQLAEIGAAGQWLWEELDKLGLDNDKKYSITFAHGQACFPVCEPWETARVILEQTKADNAPTGGLEYGKALLNGDVQGLPPGGMRIVKTQETS